VFGTSQEICWEDRLRSELIGTLNPTQLSLVYEIEFHVLLLIRFRTGRWYRAQVKLNKRTSQRSRSDWSI